MKQHLSSAALTVVLLATSTSVSSKSYRLAFTSSCGPISLTPSYHTQTTLSASIVDNLTSDIGNENSEALLTSRNRLVALSSTLSSNSSTGRFISRSADKIKLQKAINELELVSPPMGEKERDLMVGDWSLVATANVANSEFRRRRSDEKQKNWFGNGRPGLSLFERDGLSFDRVQNTIRKSIEVTQRIRNDGDSNGDINRVDNVIEFTPIDTLKDIIPIDSPFAFLSDLNVNPLKVKKSKVVLIHKAVVESVMPVLRTKIGWVSSVVNVAGTSQFFEPEGTDIFGVNNLLGEFLNTGTFETPYIDQEIRISRTRGPVFEQLRVFVRKDSGIMDSDIIDALKAELRMKEEVEESQKGARIEAQVKKVTDATENIGEAAESIGDNVRIAVQNDMEKVNRALSYAMDDIVEKVQDAVEDDLQEIGSAIKGVQSSIQGEDDIVDAVGNVTKAIAKVPHDVKKVVDDGVAYVSESVEGASDAMVKDVQDAVEKDLKRIDNSIIDIRDVAAGKGSTDEKDDTEEDE